MARSTVAWARSSAAGADLVSDNAKRLRAADFLQKYFHLRKDSFSAGVIELMKPTQESQRMYRSRVLLGSLAASTAMICVLSLSSPAVSAEGGFFDRPLTQAQCCFTGNSRDLIADGAGHPFLISDGGRAMDRISPRIKAPGLKLAELKADDRPITAATVSWQTVGTLTYARTNSSEHKALLHSTISGNGGSRP